MAVIHNSYRRVNRRRFLATVGASALLIACSGDESPKKNVSSLLTPPKDTTGQAKPGGALPIRALADPLNFDPHLQGNGSPISRSLLVHDLLTRIKPGRGQRADRDFEGGMASSWEMSPDKLSVTFKVRPNKWHDVAPVNGRSIDAEDFAASWRRFESLTASGAANYSANLNPDAAIESVKAVDGQTFVMKLSQPVSSIIGVLAGSDLALCWLPKEAGVSYEPRTKAIGSGPFSIAEYLPSSRLELKRHEGYWEKAYPATVNIPIIPEYASALAQFEKGALLEFTYGIRQEDVLDVKQRNMDMQLYVWDPQPNYGMFKFGWNPARGEKTPFRDKRLRQALALSIDRQLVLDTIYDLPKMAQSGIQLQSYLHTAIMGDVSGGHWLDPNGKDFGSNAKFFKKDVAEAKKLIAAAGFPNGLSYTATWSTPGYPDLFQRQAAIYTEFGNEAGLKFTRNNPGYTTEFRPQYFFNQGDFDGFVLQFRPAANPPSGPAEIAFQEYNPATGSAYCGYFSETSSYMKGDPQVTELIRKARAEFDEKRQMSLLHDFQRLEASNQYRPAFVGVADSLGLSWPALQNFNVLHTSLNSGLNSSYRGVWIDETLPPLKRS